MSQWALPTIAVMLIAYGAVSGRLRSTPVCQAMVFVALGLLVGNRVLDLVAADTANQFVRHLAEAASYGHRGLRSSGAHRGPTTAARGIKRGQQPGPRQSRDSSVFVVGPGLEPDSSDWHVRAFGADRDFAEAPTVA
jgi:hypothetical protein